MDALVSRQKKGLQDIKRDAAPAVPQADASCAPSKSHTCPKYTPECPHAAPAALQMDVTDIILAERHVLQLQQQQSALLKEILPQQVIEHLLAHKAPIGEGGQRGGRTCRLRGCWQCGLRGSLGAACAVRAGFIHCAFWWDATHTHTHTHAAC